MLDRLGSDDLSHVEQTMARHDMVSHPDEGYYLDQYLHWLEPVVDGLRGRGALVVDAGCGQGRLALAVAERLPDARVVGVDVAAVAVREARRYAAERGLANAEFHEGDATAFVRALDVSSVDLALFTEVSFWMPGYHDALAALARTLKPSGTLFASLRSQFYNLLWLVRERNFDGARRVRDERRGHLRDSPLFHSWHTSDDVRRELGELGFEVERLCAIGVLSGVAGDPLGSVAQPSALTAAQRAELQELEISLAERYADEGRYILAVARRR